MNKGLYIHFPFCEKKCNYCDFYSVASSAKRSEYIDALCREMSAFEGEKINTVYLGGGTPSLMSKDELKKVLNSVFNTFSVDADTEITLEANPMSVNCGEKLADLKALGVNRLSIGVQSFCDNELSALGRGHTAQEAIATVSEATKHFDNVSIDLMLAIPHQTKESFNFSLDTAVSLGIQHISVYALSIEEKTVFGVKQRRGENLFLPDEDTEREMYFSACERLKNAGYEHYEISNFAKDGFRSRHNMKYWLAEEYIGIGASAHSYYNGERYSLSPDIKGFCQGTPKLDSYTNTSADRLEETVFLSLRLSDGLNMQKHSIPITEKLKSCIDLLSKNGLCSFDGKTLTLTEKGFFVSNSVIVKMLESME